ncbi:MAG: nucleoside-diphosphate kinase [Candidatus Omnitrophica bacterium]|nr:nucleoside-diphosphate kinase [Candidatus Omnitrophota bacterium]
MIQQTLVLIKPDGLVRSLTGNILTRLSETKLEIVAAKITRVSKEVAEAQYRQLRDKPFYPELIQYLQGELHDRRKVLAMIYWGQHAITKLRSLAGSTNPEEADPVSIRGSYGRIRTSGLFENVIHASSSEAEAEREIKLWFQPDEIIVDLYPTQEVTLKEVKVRQWAP